MNWPRKRGDALFDPSDLESYGVWSLDERLEPTHPVLDDTASILDRTDYLSFVDNSESETNHGSYLTDTTPPLDGPIEDGEPMTGIERQLAPNIIPDISGPEPVRDENLRIEDSPICAGSPATPDDCPMPDAASPLPEEMVPSVVYPQPERDVVHSGASPQGQKRTRLLKDKESTNKVRRDKACVRCKLRQKKCVGLEGVCAECRNGPFPRETCGLRGQLVSMVRIHRNRWSFSALFMLNDAQFDQEKPMIMKISFPDRATSPPLEITAHPFTEQSQQGQNNQSVLRLGIMPKTRRTWGDKISDWAKKNLDNDDQNDFESQMDKLLRLVVNQQKGEDPLLSTLLEMKCMWRILCCKNFVLEPHVLRVQDATCVEGALRQHAAESIARLEGKVLNEIDPYLKKDQGKCDQRQPGETAKNGGTREMKYTRKFYRWLGLWQMLLIYRQSLVWVREQEKPTGMTDEAVRLRAKQREFEVTTQELLKKTTVVYVESFHKYDKLTKPVLDGLNNTELITTFENAWRKLQEFHEKILAVGQVVLDDNFFIEHVVKKELEYLKKSRTLQR